MKFKLMIDAKQSLLVCALVIDLVIDLVSSK